MAIELYKQYLAEREGAHLLAHDWGFAVYKYGADHVYLQDIFVIEAARDTRKGTQLMMEVAEIAKAKGITLMYGSIDPRTEASSRMMKVMLHLGFLLSHNQGDLIMLKREL